MLQRDHSEMRRSLRRDAFRVASLELTKGLHRFDQFKGEGFVSGQVFKHAGDLVMPRPNNVTAINALYVVAHTDHLHPVHNTSLFDTLPGKGQGVENMERKGQRHI